MVDRKGLTETQHWLLQHGRRYLEIAQGRVFPQAASDPPSSLPGLTPNQRVLLDQQLEWRKRSRTRFPDPGLWLWTDRSLSQASDWWTALFKARLFPENELVIDGCCGAGADAVAFAGRGPVLAIDSDPWLAALTENNATAHGRIVTAFAEPFSVESLRGAKFLHVDPDRRPVERKVLDADQFSPPLSALLELVKSVRGAVLKIAPATQMDSELWNVIEQKCFRVWVGNRGECRQQLLVSGEEVVARLAKVLDGLETSGPKSVAVNLSDSGLNVDWFSGCSRTNAERVSQEPRLLRYIYDLHATLFASKLHPQWAEQNELQAIGDEHGFYTSDRLVQTPWASAFEVLEIFAWDDRRVRKWLREHHAGPVEVKNRLVRMNASAYQRRYSDAERGEPVTLLVTRLGSTIKCIATRRKSTR